VNGDAEQFLARLRAEYETSAVPGRFFEMPGHFRVGMGVNSEMFREGLRRIGLMTSPESCASSGAISNPLG
jgi:aspartate/methionine/tyrosine aminotransferase